MIDGMRSAAAAKGNRPQDFEVYYRVFSPPSKEDVVKMREIGVNHIILDFSFGAVSAEAILGRMTEIKN